MNKKWIKEKVAQWVDLRGRQQILAAPPKVRLNGEIYPWIASKVHVSSLPGLNYCTYGHGLLAKIQEETGEVPLPSEETRLIMGKGSNGHLKEGKLQEIPPELDFSKEEVRGDPTEALRNLLSLEDIETCELLIGGVYKGIYLSGAIDLAQFHFGSPSITEWKFTKNGKVKRDHILQVKVYAYLMHKWLDFLGFPYRVSAWPLDTWNKNDQFEAFEGEGEGESPKPSDVHEGTFTEATVKEVEEFLERANSFFTGQEKCQPAPSIGCTWCAFGKTGTVPKEYRCPYSEEPMEWVEGQNHGKDPKTGDYILSFKVS